MKGKALVALLSLAAAGCVTHGSANLPRKVNEPVAYQPLRPIATSINGGLASQDPDAVRAGLAEGGQGPRPRLVAETNESRPKSADPAVSAVATNPAPTPSATMMPPVQETTAPATAESLRPVAETAVGGEIPPLPDLGTAPSGEATSSPATDKPPEDANPAPSGEATPLLATDKPPEDANPAPSGEATPLPATDKPPEDANPAPSDEATPLPVADKPPADSNPAPMPMSPPATPEPNAEQKPASADPKPAEAPVEPTLPTLPDPAPGGEPAASAAPKSTTAEPDKDQASRTNPQAVRDPSLRRVAATEADDPVAASVSKDGPAKLEGDSKRLRETKIDVPVRAPLSQTAAIVGNAMITEQELVNAYRSLLPPGNRAEIPEDDKNAKLESLLDEMIEQTMLYETAKRKVNNEKVWETISKQVELDWREHEVPKLLRRWQADNEYSLTKKLDDAGIDYEILKDYYQRGTLGYQFLAQSIQPKLKVDPPEIKRYYELNKNKYDRPARVTWREVFIDVKHHPNRASAASKAQKALMRLRRGEEFGKVVREMSEGPNAANGGIWIDTTPGGYAVAAVNDAIDRTPLNRISTILEDERSFHIIRVEARRPAGPASYPEVEKEIRELLIKKKQRKAWEEAIKKMTAKTVIDKRYNQAPLEIDPLNPKPAGKNLKPAAAPRIVNPEG